MRKTAQEERTLPDVVVNGVPYVPADKETSSIGIGITTHDRYETFKESYGRVVKLAPAGAKIVVVDDGSAKPVPEATFRFETAQGIARAKNKAMELLYDAGVEHFFLMDDDAYPLVSDWWKPYVESPEPHLMAMYDRPDSEVQKGGGSQIQVIYKDDQHVAYHVTRGYFLYAHRTVLETVGGMDPGFGQWGWEHASWSDRIHAAGLTTWRYADVVGSDKLIYSMDQHDEVKSTATDEARKFSEGPGLKLRTASRHDPRYIEFREQRDVVITSLLTKQADPQRPGQRMAAKTGLVQRLHTSLKGKPFVLLHTGIDKDLPNTEMIEVEQYINPYFERHLQSLRYLRDHPEVRFAWCVDGTDVTMLRDPFPEMEKGTLYLGYEPKTLRDQWMLDHHPDSTLQQFMKENANLPLLNAGLIGGDRETLIAFLHEIMKFYFDDHIDWIMGWETARAFDSVSGDMGTLNYVARTRFADKISSGPHVCTVFKQEEANNRTAWWKHK